MTKEEFGEGLMFYRACCGKEPELAHVEVWWEMLQYMPIDHFVGAVKLFISIPVGCLNWQQLMNQGSKMDMC